MTRILRFIGVAATVLTVLSIAGAILQLALSARERDQYPAPGRLIDIGGRRLHLLCSGDGAPTVLLDAGGGDNSLVWSIVQPRIARVTHVCAYDRAGLGWSDRGPAPRDGEHVIAELRTLLERADVPGPYVVVGHSVAGLYAGLFAARYPSETAGLVLVDPTPLAPPDDTEVRALLGSGLPLGVAGPAAWIGLHRFVFWPGVVENALPTRRLPTSVQDAYRATRYWTDALPTGAEEEEGVPSTIDAVRAAGTPADLPLVVLIVELSDADRAALSPVQLEVLLRAKREQEEFARASLRETVIRVTGTSHFVQVDRPDVVVDAIRATVEAARGK